MTEYCDPYTINLALLNASNNVKSCKGADDIQKSLGPHSKGNVNNAPEATKHNILAKSFSDSRFMSDRITAGEVEERFGVSNHGMKDAHVMQRSNRNGMPSTKSPRTTHNKVGRNGWKPSRRSRGHISPRTSKGWWHHTSTEDPQLHYINGYTTHIMQKTDYPINRGEHSKSYSNCMPSNPCQRHISHAQSCSAPRTCCSKPAYTCQIPAFPSRQGSKDNERWRRIIKKIEPYLDVKSLLIIRQTCLVLYFHKYTGNPRNELCFRGFTGYDSNVVVSQVLPLLMRVLRPTDKTKPILDFSQCYNFKNISIVYMLTTQAGLNYKIEVQKYCRSMKELVLDYCHHLTDKALDVMLNTRLPNLERLSLIGCRNENILGTPFISALSMERWPKLTRFSCSFSNINIEPIQAIASFITHIGASIRAEQEATSDSSNREDTDQWRRKPFSSCFEITRVSSNELSENTPKSEATDGAITPLEIDPMCQLEICGSWGSRMFLDRLGFGPDLCAFAAAIKMNNTKLCSRLTKRLQRALEERSRAPEMLQNSCIQLLRQRGSEILVNCPIIEHTNRGAIDIWALPISIAIENDNMDMFNLLIRRGARVNVWDHCGKSPLYTACEAQKGRFITKLLRMHQAPEPVDDRGFSPVSVCVQNDRADFLEQLLNARYKHGLLFPHIRNYKSPLYLACLLNSDACIQLLLERGADTNWLYHGRITPTLISYQNNPKWLPIFLKYGAGRTPKKRSLLSDVMSCAIDRDDLESVSLLLDAYPDLIDREQRIWSKPIVQAARLGKHDVLKLLLERKADVNQRGDLDNTALHAAAEENRTKCMELLIEHGANLNVQNNVGRTPLHLAVVENRKGAIEILLRNGCNPNIADYITGETPLMAALRARNDNVAYLIINNASGLKYDIVDNVGRSCCIYCLYFEQYEVGRLILTRYATNKLQSSVTEIRWFNAIAQKQLKSKTVTLRRLKGYIRHFRKVNARVIKENKQPVLPSTKWPMVKSLLGRFRWLTFSKERQQKLT